jgi:hypothetical protein
MKLISISHLKSQSFRKEFLKQLKQTAAGPQHINLA